MAAPLAPPVPLSKSHELDGFGSGVAELDEWLIRYGWANHAAGNARVFVACRANRVVGYYTLSAAAVAQGVAPPDLLKGGSPREVPCLLLGRLAVTRQEQGRHLGRSLLADALRRAVRLSNEIGFRSLLVHARDDAARSWYLHQARSFQGSPTDPLHLFLPVKELRRLAEEV